MLQAPPSPTILIVEDEPTIALGLKNDLKMEGYAVEVEPDGESGCERARKESFDLILLDLMLPRKDGLTICRELRRAGIRTPIIMLTAKAQEADKVVGFDLGEGQFDFPSLGIGCGELDRGRELVVKQ